MKRRILSETRFRSEATGWEFSDSLASGLEIGPRGGLVSAKPGSTVTVQGPGVHTRNGDRIELHFQLLEQGKGKLQFGFSGGMESALVTLDFKKKQVFLNTSDWTSPQPVTASSFKMLSQKLHVICIEKIEGEGGLVKNADLRVFLDGNQVLAEDDINVLPEMGVMLRVTATRMLLKRFVHRGVPSGVPEYLHVGAWQMLNRPCVDENLKSIFLGLEEASNQGVQLLLTTETSLTGLFPTHRVTKDRKPVEEAENKVQKFIRNLKNAPYVVVGLPIWESIPGHRRKVTRFNVSRVYDPDGGIVDTYAKIHSCETEFWHGYRLQEFDIYGVPVCMHICHDGRYPGVWTLPVMFGARLVLHPSNGGVASGSIDAFEKVRGITGSSHAFYIHVNGGGGSYIVGPQKYNNLIAVSAECKREVSTFPMIGPPQECLLDAKIRIWDAFGYWPVRSFRASEEVASAQLALYQAMGGRVK